MAGVLKVEVGSRSRIARSFGGSHSQKKFKCQSNPPLKYVETGSKCKSEKIISCINKAKYHSRGNTQISITNQDKIHLPLKWIFSITGHTSLFGLSFMRRSRGSSHPGSTSQWLSKNTSTSPVAWLLALTRDLIKPSRTSFLITLTLYSFWWYHKNCSFYKSTKSQQKFNHINELKSSCIVLPVILSQR